LLIGCSQEGDLSVHNDSGPDLEVNMDGSSYLLDDGDTVTKRIDLGRKFIFGPDEQGILVWGEGYCKLPFEDVVVVDDGRNAVYSVYGDAGYIDICNETGFTVELYLSPSIDNSWGDPVELVPSSYCTLWMLEEGYWDMLAVTIEGQYEEYDILIAQCATEAYDLLAASLTKVRTTGVKAPRASSPATATGRELRKLNKGSRKVQR